MGLLHEGDGASGQQWAKGAHLMWGIGRVDCPLFFRILLVGVVSWSHLRILHNRNELMFRFIK